MHVLIVEDDAALGLFLAKGLNLEGHEVELATDGHSGLDMALERRPELMVLDLSLPQMDGIQVLEAMQGHLAGTSVLVLTGRNGLEHRIRCLNLGADNCLLKPFSFSELTARCQALLRRRVQYADPMLRVRGVELNRMDRTVNRDGRGLRCGERLGMECAGIEMNRTSIGYRLGWFCWRRAGSRIRSSRPHSRRNV